jgi:hypothetical protein
MEVENELRQIIYFLCKTCIKYKRNFKSKGETERFKDFRTTM